jgi:hypothetical protein
VLALVLATLVAVQDSMRPAAPVPPDAFADSGTAGLLGRAREHRSRAERLVTAYEAFVRQRIGVGMRALRRDRMIFHQGLAARIRWRRDTTSVIEMVGARQAVPVAMPGAHVPQGLADWAGFLAFDPAEDYLRLIANDTDGMLSPLAPNAEQRYRYAPGDTTRLTLPSGREVQVIEVRVTARRPSFFLVNGSLWFDADTWGLVRMVVRPSRPFDLRTDGDSGDADDVPRFLMPGVDIQYITVEYGLYDSRWWLPRLWAIDGEVTVGSVMRIPARFERVYEIARVVGGGEPPAEGPPRWRAGARRPNLDSLFRADSSLLPADSIAALVTACAYSRDSATTAAQATRDSLRRAGSRERAGVRVEVRVGGPACVRRRVLEAFGQPTRPDISVVMPPDTMELLAAEELGPPILDMGDVISERELAQVADAIRALPGVAWQLRPSFNVDLFRYNRVEALSAGARGQLDLGKLRLDASARLGLADVEPNVELAALRPGRSLELRFVGYRRLTAVDPPAGALGFGNSLSSLPVREGRGRLLPHARRRGPRRSGRHALALDRVAAVRRAPERGRDRDARQSAAAVRLLAPVPSHHHGRTRRPARCERHAARLPYVLQRVRRGSGAPRRGSDRRCRRRTRRAHAALDPPGARQTGRRRGGGRHQYRRGAAADAVVSRRPCHTAGLQRQRVER